MTCARFGSVAVRAAACAALCALAMAGPRPARGAEPGGAPAAAGGQAILSESSPWRWHYAFRKPTVPVERMKAAGREVSAPVPLAIVKLHGGRGTPDIQLMDSPPPADGWAGPEFDDSDWPRSRGPFNDLNVCVGTVCLRGRFLVTDPAAVGSLRLALRYRGGVIVYLNGREVARSGLPAGKVALTAPADPYPDEAWVGADGKMLPIPRADRKGMTEDDVVRMARRDRSLGPVEIPAAGLVRGVNVLAVELHRSDYHPAAIGWWQSQNLVQGITKQWTPVGLIDLALSAAKGGAVANVDRAPGLQAWTADLNARLDAIGYADPQDSPRPMAISGARNGVFSGLAGISGPGAIRKARAAIGELSAVGGGRPAIPASAVQVRYVVAAQVGAEQISGGGSTATLQNGLAEVPPDEVAPAARRLGGRDERGRTLMAQPAAMLPVLVTVRVPADAAPGDYAGSLRLSAEGLAETSIPVRLHVADWAVPAPREFRTRLGIFQSPTTLALKYNVPEWSEEHWKLMDKSFALLGELGGTLVNIPLSDRTQFGNDEGMVYWLRQADGSYKYDFTVFDRYLKLVRKHLGTPKYVALHLWHPGTWHARPLDSENTVTVVDAKTGKRERMQVPIFGGEESRKFWKPVLDECRARLAREGLEKSMCLGILCDATAQPEVFKQFDDIWPGGGPAGWTRGCHSTTFAAKPYGLKGGGVCVYHEFCYGLSLADPDKKFPPIHAMTGPGTAWFRGEYDYRLPPWIYRTMAERGLYCHTSGVGRMGLDFWAVPYERGGRAKSYCVFNRWPHSSVGGHGDPTLSGLADPGPDGARGSVRLEIFREGVQEAEAAIVLSDAIANNAARLGPELSARCRALIVERINVCRATQGMTEEFYAGWQDRATRLYAAAAEVAARTGAR